jgi:hypothetical protein
MGIYVVSLNQYTIILRYCVIIFHLTKSAFTFKL